MNIRQTATCAITGISAAAALIMTGNQYAAVNRAEAAGTETGDMKNKLIVSAIIQAAVLALSASALASK